MKKKSRLFTVALKELFFSLCLLLVSFMSFSQNISGTVSDADRKPIGDATVQVVSNRRTEAFANFRRTGLPALSPTTFNNKLYGAFVSRMSYPDVEGLSNTTNYPAGAAAIGDDKFITGVFRILSS